MLRTAWTELGISPQRHADFVKNGMTIPNQTERHSAQTA